MARAESFELPKNLICSIEKMPEQMQGRIFMLILEFVNGRPANIKDAMLAAAFEPIRAYLETERERREKIARRNRANGKKGGRPKKAKRKPQAGPEEAAGAKARPTEKKPAAKPVTNGTAQPRLMEVEPVKPKPKPLEVRKKEFHRKIAALIGPKYDKKMATDFFRYWSEHGENDKKMKFEKEKTFGVASRMHTWYRISQERAQKAKKEMPRL